MIARRHGNSSYNECKYGELATPCRYFNFGKQAGFNFQFEKILWD